MRDLTRNEKAYLAELVANDLDRGNTWDRHSNLGDLDPDDLLNELVFDPDEEA